MVNRLKAFARQFPPDIRTALEENLDEKRVSQYVYFTNKRVPEFFSPNPAFYGKTDGINREFKELLTLLDSRNTVPNLKVQYING